MSHVMCCIKKHYIALEILYYYRFLIIIFICICLLNLSEKCVFVTDSTRYLNNFFAKFDPPKKKKRCKHFRIIWTGVIAHPLSVVCVFVPEGPRCRGTAVRRHPVRPDLPCQHWVRDEAERGCMGAGRDPFLLQTCGDSMRKERKKELICTE